MNKESIHKISNGIDKISINKNISNKKKIVMLEKLKIRLVSTKNKANSNNELNSMVTNYENNLKEKSNEKVNKDAKVYVKSNGFANPLILVLMLSVLLCVSIMIGFLLSNF